MLKPVSILALDDLVAPLAFAVQQRVAAHHGLEDLVQARTVGDDLAQTIQSIHAQRQRPDSPLRVRDDVSSRELILVMAAAAGPARTALVETTRRIREIYETRRHASFFSVELLCLLPETCGAMAAEDYAAAYALLKALSAEEAKPFDEVWLLDATNGRRVKFGALDTALATYADAIAGALTYEPEMSGALPGIHPRGMHPTFSSFGYASLVFPRETALQRVEPRFAAQLIWDRLLNGDTPSRAQLAAKQFMAGDGVAMPLSRIGVEAGQSLFRRFQPKTQVNERTRSADELIAAVRGELQAFRDSTHLRNLETLARQGEQTRSELTALLARTVDEALDRDGYEAALALLDALLDPLPELRAEAELAPRNLVTEMRSATSALDTRLRLAPDTAASDAARKRVRALETLIADQQLVADTTAASGAASQLEEMEREKASLLAHIPELLFAEERENNAARSAARDEEAARLAVETEASEQALRELFAQLPGAEQALRDALETRKTWLWRQLFTAAAGIAAFYAIPFLFDVLWPNLANITSSAITAAGAFTVVTAFRYFTRIVPLVRDARERLARLRSHIATADAAKNVAHNAELQFEYDVTHRRTTLRVLREVHQVAGETALAVRTRKQALEELAATFVPVSIAASGLSLVVVEDAEVDAWYERTVDDRKPFVREFPIGRAQSRHLPLEEVRQRITSHAAAAFAEFRKLTLAGAASSVANPEKLAQRLKRFTDTAAPLIELRDDDLPAQRVMQRDCTLWIDTTDAHWLAALQRRFPDAQVKPSDALGVHALTRVLHYPGYVLGQIDYYRVQYEAANVPDGADDADLVPPDLLIGASVCDAYERVLLARATGVLAGGENGVLLFPDLVLGDSNLTAARTLAAPESESVRAQLETALAPRLEIAGDVRRNLRQFRDSSPLTPLDRNVLNVLLKRY